MLETLQKCKNHRCPGDFCWRQVNIRASHRPDSQLAAVARGACSETWVEREWFFFFVRAFAEVHFAAALGEKDNHGSHSQTTAYPHPLQTSKRKSFVSELNWAFQRKKLNGKQTWSPKGGKNKNSETNSPRAHWGNRATVGHTWSAPVHCSPKKRITVAAVGSGQQEPNWTSLSRASDVEWRKKKLLLLQLKMVFYGIRTLTQQHSAPISKTFKYSGNVLLTHGPSFSGTKPSNSLKCA